MPLVAGTRLGPYEILALIGSGGMGEVYRAHDSRLNRVVAIKTLRSDVARDPERLQRFEAEARAASALNHPNILTIHDVGQDGETAYIAMEWVDGTTLRAVMAAGRLSTRRLLKIGPQIAAGLAKAHAAGIIHRDLKPENVMIADEGLAKIVDFGLAKLVTTTDESPSVTHGPSTLPGVVMGTVGYMSPEQASGRPADHRSDQFAFGLIAYEMATGRRPFQRETAAQTLAATIDEEPTPIRELNAEVPEHLTMIVDRCLAKDPRDRYDSTRDLARDLVQIAESAGPQRVTGSVRSTPRLARWLSAVAGLAACIAIAVVAKLWPGRSADRNPRQPPLVAVREFRNLSPQAEQSYFAAGMTEEIRGQLSRISALRLLSRAAVDKYEERDLPRMVAELGVGSIVDGSVRLDRDRVRISAVLVDARNEHTLWSEQYERGLADIFAVQSDVALQIARSLQANLSPAERARVQKRPTANLEAYDLYLKSEQIPTGATAGMDLLRRALALDPLFAVAKASLAYRLAFRSYQGDSEALDRAATLAREAMEIDPNLADPHVVLGTVYVMKGQDAQARLAFMRALELDPNDTTSMGNLSVNEGQFGRLDDSLLWARRKFVISGRTGNDYYHVGFPLLALRDDELTGRWLTYAERQAPPHARVQLLLASAELVRGDDGASLARIRRAATLWPTNREVAATLAELAFLVRSDDAAALTEKVASAAPDTTGVVIADGVRVRRAHFLQRRGNGQAAAEADEVLRLGRQALAQGSENPVTSVNMAAASMVRGDRDAAHQFLSRAVTSGYRDYAFLVRDPIFEPIASDGRFRALVDQMTADVARQRGRATERGLLDLGSLVPGLK